jgi:hypothetical protein
MTPGHRVRTRCLALTATLLIVGCGSSGGTGPPSRCTKSGSAYGAVCTVIPPAAVGANASPGDGDPVNRGNTITTMPGGDILFWIRDKIKWCEIFDDGSNGGLTVWPASGAPQVLIHYLTGAVACSTLHSGGAWTMTAGSHAKITMTDPVWVILIDPTGAVTIQVVDGALTVSTDIGQGPTRVAAGEEVTVDPNGNIAPIVKFLPERQAKEEQAAVQRVQQSNP